MGKIMLDLILDWNIIEFLTVALMPRVGVRIAGSLSI